MYLIQINYNFLTIFSFFFKYTSLAWVMWIHLLIFNCLGAPSIMKVFSFIFKGSMRPSHALLLANIHSDFP